MLVSYRFIVLQVILAAASAVAAFSSISVSNHGGISCRRASSSPLFMSSNGEEPQADSSMSRLIEALQRMEVKSTSQNSPQPANHHLDTSASATSTNNFNAATDRSNNNNNMPRMDSEGLYQISTKEQHAAFLKANPDKLIVMKFTAGYCQACKALKPKFRLVMNDTRFQNMPIVWAEFKASPNNKAFFRRLGVLSLPTVHFYDGIFGLEENFQCGPANVGRLMQKLTQFLNDRVDPWTRQLKEPSFTEGTDAPARVRQVQIGGEFITQEHLDYLRDELPFFEELTDAEFDDLLSKASLQTFLPGDIVIRQGMPGNAFYVVKSGLLEMSIKSRFDDPISTPPSYLGAVVNTLTKFDYFGERALTTGEPLSASVRVLEKARCFVFKVEDIPEGSILSQKRRANRALVDKLTARYKLPKGYKPAYATPTEKDETILELLVRFKQIRQAVKAFDYFIKSEPLLGDRGQIARRSMLVSKLSESQKQDIIDVFNMADVYGKGHISLLEMRRFMESARRHRTDAELTEMINRVNPSADGTTFGVGIGLDEFMGIMAEAEFYYLFTETFQELDPNNTGYVRAGDLDEVLGGVRDLISGDYKSLIDVQDQDIQVDYEQFAKMLLGAAL